MDNKKWIIEYAFKGFASIVMFLSLFIFNGFGDSIAKMQESINELNVNFASFSQQLLNGEKERSRLEARMDRLETSINNKYDLLLKKAN